jgi:cation:H+ antiporter
MTLLFPALEIALLLCLIVGCCALFTNAIEWTGHRFNLSEGAVGSVLAAVGTALPETLVPIIAIVSGMLGLSGLNATSGHDIGMGAILGAPFLLSTLAFFLAASALFYFSAIRKRSVNLKVDFNLFRRDLHYFFMAYLIVFAAAFIPDLTVKTGLAVFLLGFYGVYVYRTVNKSHMPNEEFDLPRLFFWKKSAVEPPTAIIMGQLVASLLLLLVMAHLFVEQIQHVATVLQIPTLLLSLIITPIATELPEKFNSVMWIKDKKDNLAFGNLTGAMVFQSCVPTAIGLVFTPWILNKQGFLSVILCLFSSVVAYGFAWKSQKAFPLALLVAGGSSYLLFLLFALFSPVL